MESLYILIPIALLLAGLAIATFLWAVRSRQFDNLDMEARRLLFDDEPTLRHRDDGKQEPSGVDGAGDDLESDNVENNEPVKKPHE